MDLIVQKAVEIGAAEIVLIISDRTIVRLDEADAAQKQTKWQAIAIEAAKQCGQNWLPEVQTPRTLAQFFAKPPHFDLQLIGSLQSDARHLKKILADHPDRPKNVLMLIGPEGDFTPAELNLARAKGCQPITLGPIILRVENRRDLLSKHIIVRVAVTKAKAGASFPISCFNRTSRRGISVTKM